MSRHAGPRAYRTAPSVGQKPEHRGDAYWFAFGAERLSKPRPVLIASGTDFNQRHPFVTVWTGTISESPWAVREGQFARARRDSLRGGEGFFKPFDLATLRTHNIEVPDLDGGGRTITRGVEAESYEGRSSEPQLLPTLCQVTRFVIFGGSPPTTPADGLIVPLRDGPIRKSPAYRNLAKGTVVRTFHRESLQTEYFLVVSSNDFHRRFPFETFVGVPVVPVSAKTPSTSPRFDLDFRDGHGRRKVTVQSYQPRSLNGIVPDSKRRDPWTTIKAAYTLDSGFRDEVITRVDAILAEYLELPCAN